MQALARNWWVLVVRGGLAVLFGILALVLPGATVTALVILFGAFLLVDGLFALVSAWRRAERRRSWWAFVTGVFEIAAAIRLRREIRLRRLHVEPERPAT